GAGGSAFGEQRAQPSGAAQLNRQATVDLCVAGEQRGGRSGFAEQFDGGRGLAGHIGRAFADLLPAVVQVYQNATHPGFLYEETGQLVAIGGRRRGGGLRVGLGHIRLRRGGSCAGARGG